jgi:hypothetical protein
MFLRGIGRTSRNERSADVRHQLANRHFHTVSSKERKKRTRHQTMSNLHLMGISENQGVPRRVGSRDTATSRKRFSLSGCGTGKDKYANASNVTL